MTLYRVKMELALKNNSNVIKRLEKHKDFYPLVEELREVFKRDFWVSQNDTYTYVSTYLQKDDDKTLPLLMEELILSKSWIKQAMPSESLQGEGEIIFHFHSTKPRFGAGERPRMKLSVIYSALCKRVVKGTRLVEDYEYQCD